MLLNPVEKIFYEDIREKKRTGTGVYKRRGKGKKHTISSVKTTYDYLTNKEKKQLNGEVKVVFNMFQPLQNIKEFKKKSKTEQKLVLEAWRKEYRNTEIIKALGVSHQTYYDMLNKLDIKVEKRNKREKGVPIEGLIDYEDFKKLPKPKQKEMLTELRNTYKSEDIRKTWGLSDGGFYNLVVRLGVELKRKYNTIKKPAKPFIVNMSAWLNRQELMDYKTFRSMTEENQAELLQEYKRRMKIPEIAKEWGIGTGTLYTYSGQLNKVKFTPTNRKKVLSDPLVIDPNKPEGEQIVLPLHAEPEEPKSEPVVEVVEEAKEEPIEAGIEEATEESVMEQPTEPVVEEPTVETEVEPPVVNEEPKPSGGEEVTLDQNTLQQIFNFMQSQTQAQAQAGATVEAPQEPIVETVPKRTEVAEKIPTNGFTVQYEETKEGFLLHQEISHILNMLQKNPSTYKLSLKVEKVD